MATEKVLSRARKLKALANAGEGGEQENAQRMYEAYIKEHNIEDCEINFSMNVREIDDIANTTEADIAYTILLSVNPYAKCSFSGNVMSTELDDEDYVEAKEKIKYFLTLWRLEVNALKGAFSLRHNEFFKPDEHALKKWRDNNVGQSQWSQEVAKQESKDIYDLSEKINEKHNRSSGLIALNLND